MCWYSHVFPSFVVPVQPRLLFQSPQMGTAGAAFAPLPFYLPTFLFSRKRIFIDCSESCLCSAATSPVSSGSSDPFRFSSRYIYID